jgi:hypothetical protein
LAEKKNQFQKYENQFLENFYVEAIKFLKIKIMWNELV